MTRLALAAALVVGFWSTACSTVPVDVVPIQTDRPARPPSPRVLAVTAHPDDEAAFSGTLYKIATHLHGACDLFVITNGEAGYKYTTIAEGIYDLPLTDPEVGRAELPRIRRHELIDAARILHLRDLYLLGETDNHYTTDPNEVLAPDAHVWNLPRIRECLDWVLRRGDYDFVFVHRPTPSTHGHHQAATILALQAVAALPEARRPIVLAAGGGPFEGKEPPPDELPGWPITKLRTDVGPFEFDRTQKFGFRDRLDYRVVTRLAASAHRSQGTYLMYAGQGEKEVFRLFAIDGPDAAERTGKLFERLKEPQFPPLQYDEDGELISAARPADDRLTNTIAGTPPPAR